MLTAHVKASLEVFSSPSQFLDEPSPRAHPTARIGIPLGPDGQGIPISPAGMAMPMSPGVSMPSTPRAYGGPHHAFDGFDLFNDGFSYEQREGPAFASSYSEASGWAGAIGADTTDASRIDTTARARLVRAVYVEREGTGVADAAIERAGAAHLLTAQVVVRPP